MAWDPDIGQADRMHSGTAATYIELEDCDVDKAFDISVLQQAHDEERRNALDINTLYDRINWEKLTGVVALHALNLLTEAIPSLHNHRDIIQIRFKTTLAIHRMCEGRKTKLYPLATSDLNEGITEENAKVLDDIFLHQLNLPKDEVARLLVIVGGDQSTVEKAEALESNNHKQVNRSYNVSS